jgi:hypothetical protein
MTVEELVHHIRALSPSDRTRARRELTGPTTMAQFGAPRPPAAQSVAWLKAERGHAVLATDTGPAEADIPSGAAAISGIWKDRLPENTP